MDLNHLLNTAMSLWGPALTFIQEVLTTAKSMVVQGVPAILSGAHWLMNVLQGFKK